MPDTSAPRITSFSLLQNEYEIGDTVEIQYAATDATGIDYVIFYYYDEANIKRTVRGNAEEGVATLVIDETFVSGQYDLKTITARDTSSLMNDAAYSISGDVLSDDTSWQHDFDFTNYSFTVSNSGPQELEIVSSSANLVDIHLDFSFQNWSQITNSFALELVYDPTKFDYEKVTLVGSGSSSVSTSLNAVNNEATLMINGSFANGADDGTVRLTFTNQLEEADIFLPTITSLSLNSVDQTVSLEPLSLDEAVRNSDPSGQPVIEGTAAIGETLTVNTENITDDDGLGEFSYQWMRDGAVISGADSATYLVSSDDGDAVLSVQVSYTDQLGTVESLTSENTSSIVSPHEYADNFTITSSFGTSVYEGTLPGAEEGSGNQISFTINQIDPQIRSVYVALKPASGQTTDFWDNFWSNKIGGEPADQFALGTFTSVDGGPVTAIYTLNADSAVEENETFVFSVYEDNMDFALGRKAIKSFEFSVLDDDTTQTFTSDLYDRSGADVSGFQLSTSSESATGTYVTDSTGMFEWSSTPGATVEFVSATAYSNSSRAVTSADALDALKLSVGLMPSNGTPTAYDYIAADFNRDGKVTSSDALDILKYAVGLEVERDAEWVFIRSDDDLSAVGKNSVGYDTNILIEDITSDAEIGLVGILIGDVNDSYSNFNSLPTGDVNILGTLVPYETLSVDADSLSDANGLGPFTYQWLRDGTSIPNATLSEYALQPIDIGSVISVSLSYIDGSGNNETVTSNTTDTVTSYYSGVVFIDDNIGTHEKTYQALKTWGEGSLSKNYSNSAQIGTDIQFDITDKFKSEFVIRGEPNKWHEIILNTDYQNVEDAPGYAIFLHDSDSDFPNGTELTVDSFGNLSTQRIYGITDISGSAGDDVINLTSPEYSLSAHTILIGTGNGDDIIWGSDADERIDGQNGNDIIFGGAGNNRLAGGTGADEFQFTGTSTNDTLLDFNISEGDTLRFFNTGPSEFDRNTLSLNQESGELSIKYGEQVITLTFENALPTLSDLTPDVLII